MLFFPFSEETQVLFVWKFKIRFLLYLYICRRGRSRSENIFEIILKTYIVKIIRISVRLIYLVLGCDLSFLLKNILISIISSKYLKIVEIQLQTDIAFTVMDFFQYLEVCLLVWLVDLRFRKTQKTPRTKNMSFARPRPEPSSRMSPTAFYRLF